MAADPQRISSDRSIGAQRIAMTEDEYLAFDRASDFKYEYHDGEMVALAGGTVAHNHLAGTMYYLLREQMGHSGPCRVYNSDMRVQVTQRRYVYPDAVVSCDIADHQLDSDILYSPRLIIEVISPSTEVVDRRQKANWYRALSSVYEYVLVNVRFKLVEVHRRNGNSWIYLTYGEGDEVELASLDLHFAVDDLYEGLRIPPVSSDEV